MSNDNNLAERISSLETLAKANIKRLEKLEDNNNLLYKMNVLLEVLTDANKKSDHKIDLLEEVIHSINNNLTNLNSTQGQLNDKVDGIISRVDKIEDADEKQKDRGKFDVIGFITNDAFRMFLVAVVTFLLAYFGLSG